jgi:hypothetical protein
LRSQQKAMSTAQDITEKKYRKLVLLVGTKGFSYSIHDTLSGKVDVVKHIDFSKFPRANRVEDHYWKAFVDNYDLTRDYDEVLVIHNNNLNTFVPTALFDAEYLGSYLQYNTKVFETDFFDYDEIANSEMNNVYIPYVNINNFLIDQYGPFTYKNANSVLVSRLLELSKNIDSKRVFVHFTHSCFEIVVVQNQKLLLFNSFEYTTKEDFLYYLLFTAEQLNLNPETFRLQLLGEITEDSEYFQMAYKYVRNVSLIDLEQRHENLTKAEQLRHFILLQS